MKKKVKIKEEEWELEEEVVALVISIQELTHQMKRLANKND